MFRDKEIGAKDGYVEGLFLTVFSHQKSDNTLEAVKNIRGVFFGTGVLKHPEKSTNLPNFTNSLASNLENTGLYLIRAGDSGLLRVRLGLFVI